MQPASSADDFKLDCSSQSNFSHLTNYFQMSVNFFNDDKSFGNWMKSDMINIRETIIFNIDPKFECRCQSTDETSDEN